MNCRPGYYYDSTDSICYFGICIAHCDKCLNSITCVNCTSGFYYYYDSWWNKYICSSCIAHCDKCLDSNSCVNCSSGYYYNSTDSICYFSTCIANCDRCFNATSCSMCNSLSHNKTINSVFYCELNHCGDLITNYSCNNPVGYSYDGCDDNCQI